jgi:endonuclease/exonuclease/phosphatase family metal-dependent hydrolase
MTQQAADTTGVEFTAVSWNLFHGRDFPPDPSLHTWRSRLLRTEEHDEEHVQVNRDLAAEFATLLSGAEWDVALLQECPPRFAERLAAACGAEGHPALTSRNRFGALRSALARINPDLIASAEGGSNLTLVRSSFRCDLYAHSKQKPHRKVRIVERQEMTIHSGRPERRAMALTRVALGDERRGELCVANLHATNDQPDLAAKDVLLAAGAASEWAGDAPLLFGGDLNLRPLSERAVFDELRSRYSLAGETGPDAIDHLLSRGLATVEAPSPWPAHRRELPCSGRALRLSDHTPVQAKFQIG